MDIAGAMPLTRETLVDRLEAQLKQQILSGRIESGRALPSEREMCDAFGVGRTTVREALHRLSASGFLERKSGQLVVVDVMRLPSHELDYATLGARLSVGDVFEVRQMMEAKGCELAAKNWVEGDLEPVREALAQMRKAATTEEYHTAHLEFHMLLMRLSKNPVLISVYESSSHLLLKLPAFWRVFGSAGTSSSGGSRGDAFAADGAIATDAGKTRPPGLINGWKRHTTLFDAIEARDPAEAVRLSDDMLERIQRTLIQRMNSTR